MKGSLAITRCIQDSRFCQKKSEQPVRQVYPARYPKENFFQATVTLNKIWLHNNSCSNIADDAFT